MKIAIVGAGAIGGLLGGHLARIGVDVTLIARGPHLAAIKQNGLRVTGAGSDFTVHPKAVEDPAEAGAQDYVIVSLKSPAVANMAKKMVPLLKDDTAVVMAVNGLPWWYFHGLEGPLQGRKLTSLDPEGLQWDFIGPQRVLGCVVYPAAEVSDPGVITHVSGDRFSLGEPGKEVTDRVRTLSKLLIDAGLKAPVKKDIREEIWVKLWGNVAFNPLSALTGGTLAQICGNAETRAVAKAMMTEAENVANAVGVKMPIDIEKRIAGAAAIGEHKTSMLQDLERGRQMEIDAIIGSVAELARLVEVATPTIDAILALVRQRASLLGLYP
ncbi:MAG: 2-dehydropantoate 2-reductase [Rhodospirillaceae bacterium]|nr:MAG: 2-dehydropantoate 2-reductase [Rhodospirillaceae bacterium]